MNAKPFKLVFGGLLVAVFCAVVGVGSAEAMPQCDPNVYVPHNQLANNIGPYLWTMNLCGPKRQPVHIPGPAFINPYYQAGVLRCFTFSMNPRSVLTGNPYVALGKFALTAFQAAQFCQNRGWYYLRVY